MKLVTFAFQCKNQHRFHAPEALDYGAFVLRSVGRGNAALMDGLRDIVYTEVDNLLAAIGAYSNKSDVQRAELLQRVFGVACDRDTDGTEFLIGAMPRCPVCGSREMASWGPAEPPRAYEEAVPFVTHTAWSCLSKNEKIAQLQMRLNTA